MTSSISPGAKVVAYPPISPEWAVSATPSTPNAWHPPWAKAGVRASTTVTTTKASTTTILLRISSCTSLSIACEEGRRLEKPRPYFGSPLRIGARRGPGLLRPGLLLVRATLRREDSVLGHSEETLERCKQRPVVRS